MYRDALKKSRFPAESQRTESFGSKSAVPRLRPYPAPDEEERSFHYSQESESESGARARREQGGGSWFGKNEGETISVPNFCFVLQQLYGKASSAPLW